MIPHLRNRDRALQPFGWSGPEAEWIALVCLHSGHFHPRAVLCLLQLPAQPGLPFRPAAA